MAKEAAIPKVNVDQISRAEANLERHLAWIERFDTKSSLAIGFSLAMLGVLATVIPPTAKWSCSFYISLSLTVAMIMGSLLFLFRGQYPRVNAPNDSLIFFGTIGKLSLAEFSKRHREMSDLEYLDDLMAQIHVNALILCRKFWSLKIALILMLFSSIPWLITLYFSQLLAS